MSIPSGRDPSNPLSCNVMGQSIVASGLAPDSSAAPGLKGLNTGVGERGLDRDRVLVDRGSDGLTLHLSLPSAQRFTTTWSPP